MAAVALVCLGPSPDVTPGETADLLPADTPVHASLEALSKHFTAQSELSTLVIGFERSSAILSPEDLKVVESVAAASLRDNGGKIDPDLISGILHTPAAFDLAGQANPLISSDGHAALAVISLPCSYITKPAARAARHVQEVALQFQPPPGLKIFVTGSAGYGYDYGVATQKSHDKTVVVTVIAVICILLAGYGSPLVAAVLLGGVGLTSVVVMRLLLVLEQVGLHSGMAEQIFTFVLLFGAGIDYSLLVVSRYREFLDQELPAAEALERGLAASISSIVASAGMTLTGLAMLCLARFSVFKNSGPAVMLAIFFAALSAITLVPALLKLVGGEIFWPRYRRGHHALPAPMRFWTWTAHHVTARPKAVMLITAALLAIPAFRGLHVPWNYDALLSLKPQYPARQGTEMIARHWPTGEVAPVTVVAVSDLPKKPGDWADLSQDLVDQLRPFGAVGDIRSLVTPLGFRLNDAQSLAVKLLAAGKINSRYLSGDQQAARLDIVLNVMPLSRPALAAVEQIKAVCRQTAQRRGGHFQILVGGLTAEMLDVRSITRLDFRHVALLAIIAIAVVVTAVLQDVILAVFIVGATALSYLTTLGLTFWFFTLLGSDGIEWKVQMLLFVVLVAVGQDYSIFFTLRYAQESRTMPSKEAVEKALIHTGPVISSCGLIMAATLGSIAAGDVTVLVQLGFAFALGMLMDTFIVRPLLLPSFILMTGRKLTRAARFA
jgi:RND superfamily putative drug exporter